MGLNFLKFIRYECSAHPYLVKLSAVGLLFAKQTSDGVFSED